MKAGSKAWIQVQQVDSGAWDRWESLRASGGGMENAGESEAEGRLKVTIFVKIQSFTFIVTSYIIYYY